MPSSMTSTAATSLATGMLLTACAGWPGTCPCCPGYCCISVPNCCRLRIVLEASQRDNNNNNNKVNNVFLQRHSEGHQTSYGRMQVEE